MKKHLNLAIRGLALITLLSVPSAFAQEEFVSSNNPGQNPGQNPSQNPGQTPSQSPTQKPSSPQCTASFAITEEGPAVLQTGKVTTYAVAVTNTSGCTAQRAWVMVHLPFSVALSGSNPESTNRHGSVVWDNQTIAAGETKVYHFDLQPLGPSAKMNGKACVSQGMNPPVCAMVTGLDSDQ
jgi:hypothetical protein